MLTDRQLAFAREYAVDGIATKAYVRAGYSEKGAGQSASQLLDNPKVREAIEAFQAQYALAAGISAAAILREWSGLAMADARKITHTRVHCCPYCHGIDHKRQWTRGEYAEALDRALRDGKEPPAIEGGIGYNKKLAPHPDCPDCAGVGIAKVWVCDMRDLDPVTARLVVSVEETKDGVRVKLRDQNEPLNLIAKYLGMLNEKRELSGPNGGPIRLQAATAQEMTDEELEAIAAGSGPLLLEAEN